MSIISALHLNFRGTAREALEFYRSVFGGELTVFPYGDAPVGQGPGQFGVTWIIDVAGFQG